MAEALHLSPHDQPQLLLPPAPQFPWEVTKEWRFIIAVCAVANAVALCVQALFSAQLLFASGFVFLGLSTLFGVYYFFQARSLEGHVAALSAHSGHQNETIIKLTEENQGLFDTNGRLQAQSRTLTDQLNQWYAAIRAQPGSNLADISNAVPQLAILIRQHTELKAHILALTSEDAKRLLLEQIERDKKQIAEGASLLQSQTEALQLRDATVQEQERTFNQKKEATLTALRALGLSANGLTELAEAIDIAAKEILATATQTGHALDVGFRVGTPRPEQQMPGVQRLMTMTRTPQRQHLDGLVTPPAIDGDD